MTPTPDRRLARALRARLARRRGRLRVGASLGLLLVGLPIVAILATRFGPTDGGVVWGCGPTPVEFTLRDLDGTRWDASELRGRPVVLVSWSTWAPESRLVPAALADAVRHHPEAAFFAVLYSDDPAVARRRLAEDPLPCPLLVDPEGRLALTVGFGPSEVVVLDPGGAQLGSPSPAHRIASALDSAFRAPGSL